MNGKGSAPRPVDGEKYRRNFDEINWRSDTVIIEERGDGYREYYIGGKLLYVAPPHCAVALPEQFTRAIFRHKQPASR